MQIKQGVRVHGLKPEMLLAMMVVESVYAEYGYEAVLTSGIEGEHMQGSLHYVGYAGDFRTYDVPEQEQMVADIRGKLTEDYDVVLEDTHLHIEFQPKEAYT